MLRKHGSVERPLEEVGKAEIYKTIERLWKGFLERVENDGGKSERAEMMECREKGEKNRVTSLLAIMLVS